MPEKQGTQRRSALGSHAVVLLLLAAAAALVVYKVNITIARGPGWDTYAFLNNAAEFAGRGTGYTELHRPPFLSWLTSLAFRAGAPMHENVIQWLDGLMSLSGLVAFYLLYRRRVPRVLAGLGALSVLAVSPLWLYLGSGYTDLPSVALTGWLLVALIAATEKNPWWYLAAGVIFVLSVLTRYTALLAAFPAIVWLLLRWRPFRQARHLGAAALAGLAAYFPAGQMYASRFGDSLFPFVLAFGVTEAISAPGGEGSVSAAAPFYLNNLASFLGGGKTTLAALMLLFVAGVGLVWAIGSHLDSDRPRSSRIALAGLGLGVGIAAQLAGGMVARQFSIALGVLLVWDSLAPRDDAREGTRGRVTSSAALDATMLAWLLAYFSFHGHQTIQVPRYVITMAPALIYLIVLGWQRVSEDTTAAFSTARHHGDPRSFSWMPTVVAPTIFALVTVAGIGVAVAGTNRTPDPYVAAARTTAATLVNTVDDLDDTVIYSDLWPLTAWYTGAHASAMPFFTDDEAIAHELNKTEADFYVTIRSRRFDGFEELAKSGSATILTRVVDKVPPLPRVVLLGTAWGNYLETVTGYDFYLDSDAGRYGWEGTAFSDHLTAQDLATYDAVALFNFRWRHRAQGEEALLKYVSDGGSIVLDASGNVGSLPYELGDTVMFDTVIRRREMPESAHVDLSSARFSANHPELADLENAPFVDETGGGWFGADYEPLPGRPELEVIAQAAGRPVVALQRVGKGRVYWIGYNFVWHAFYSENEDERALIRAVFDEALGPDEVSQ